VSALRPEWQPGPEDFELLHQDYARQGIEPGTEDPALVGVLVAFLRRPARKSPA
jgi:hypothetical protein